MRRYFLAFLLLPLTVSARAGAASPDGGIRLYFSIQDGVANNTFRGSITANRITGRFDSYHVDARGNVVFKLGRVTLPRKGFPDSR